MSQINWRTSVAHQSTEDITYRSLLPNFSVLDQGTALRAVRGGAASPAGGKPGRRQARPAASPAGGKPGRRQARPAASPA
ncbi:hypothetical protein ACGFH8_05690, partial [Micromonospora sp. NPDC049175]|uniref:hypothetical protein n=1 Tax=Micromonospora sp. NPDC049175 TaxID=3364266 RepID=UPI00371EB3B1